MNRKCKISSLLVFGLILFFGLIGCSGRQMISVHYPVNKIKHRQVYIIERTTSTVVGYTVIPVPSGVVMTDGASEEEKAIGQTAVHIRNALAQKGFQTTIGNGTDIPNDVNIVVTYNDVWQWDFTMYLKSLVITFYDHETKKKLAEGSYIASGGGMHDYPDSEREAPNIIDGILAKSK